MQQAIPYTLEQFREDPTRFYHTDVPEMFVSFRQRPCTDEPDDRGEVDFCLALLMTGEGVVVVSSYHCPHEWLVSSRAQDHTGQGVYVVPWSAVLGLHTQQQAETAVACMEVDQQMLANAR